jgi:hypothetical protein
MHSLNVPTTLLFCLLFHGVLAQITETAGDSDINYTVCQTAVLAVSICDNHTSSFSALAPSVKASCLCYNTTLGEWLPKSFDDPWSSCIEYAKTADSSDYSAVLNGAGLCSRVGNILNLPASVAATTTKNGGSSSQGMATATDTATTGQGALSSSASGGGSVSSVSAAASPTTTSGARRLVVKVGETVMFMVCTLMVFVF